MRRCLHDFRMISFRVSVYVTFITRNKHFWLQWNNIRNEFHFGVLHVNSYKRLTRHWIENISFRRKFHVNTLLITFPQSFKKYLRQTLVFMWNSALREKLYFCFSRVFLASIENNFILVGRLGITLWFSWFFPIS